MGGSWLVFRNGASRGREDFQAVLVFRALATVVQLEVGKVSALRFAVGLDILLGRIIHRAVPAIFKCLPIPRIGCRLPSTRRTILSLRPKSQEDAREVR